MEIKIIKEYSNYYYLQLREPRGAYETPTLTVIQASICLLLNIEPQLFNEFLEGIDHYYEFGMPVIISKQGAELLRDRLEAIIILNKLT